MRCRLRAGRKSGQCLWCRTMLFQARGVRRHTASGKRASGRWHRQLGAPSRVSQAIAAAQNPTAKVAESCLVSTGSIVSRGLADFSPLPSSFPC